VIKLKKSSIPKFVDILLLQNKATISKYNVV